MEQHRRRLSEASGGTVPQAAPQHSGHLGKANARSRAAASTLDTRLKDNDGKMAGWSLQHATEHDSEPTSAADFYDKALPSGQRKTATFNPILLDSYQLSCQDSETWKFDGNLTTFKKYATSRLPKNVFITQLPVTEIILHFELTATPLTEMFGTARPKDLIEVSYASYCATCVGWVRRRVDEDMDEAQLKRDIKLIAPRGITIHDLFDCCRTVESVTTLFEVFGDDDWRVKVKCLPHGDSEENITTR